MNKQDDGTLPLPLFYVYAHEDEALRDELDKHLKLLQRQGLLSTWSDRQIVPGTDWSKEIDARLDSAALILLLVSSDFLASDYCYGIEMQRALARHERGEAHVIPIILRSVDWQGAPFAHLQGLPRDMKPVKSWPNQDEAFLDIAQGIRWTIEHLRGKPEQGSPASTSQGRRSSSPRDVELPATPLRQQDRQDRQRFLAFLRTRYHEILEQSLQGTALLALGLQTRPEAVMPPTRLVFRHLQQTEQTFPLGTELLHAYQEAEGEFLLLGEPGAGKSTLLVHLAQKLLVEAQQHEWHPLPVILNLSTWAQKRRPLVEWLIEDLHVSYQVPRKVGQRWIATGQVLPLLDGLDEVAASARGPCIEAINAYRRDYLVPLVVCSRTADYLMQQRRLLLPKAIVIQPLTNEQIDTYLLTAEPELVALRTMLQENPVLRELAASPLMLNLLVRSSQNTPQEELPTTGSLEEQQRFVFARYLKRMLLDTDPDVPRKTPPARLLSGLIWLAQHMRQQNRAIFYLEQLQPDSLSHQGMQRAYCWQAIRLPPFLLALFICIAVVTFFLGQDFFMYLLLFSPLALLGSLFNEPSLLSDQSQPTRKKSSIVSHWKLILHLFILLGFVLLVLSSYGIFWALLAALLGGLGIWLPYRFPLPEAQKRPSLMEGVRLPGIAVIYGFLGLLCGLLIVLIIYLDMVGAVDVDLHLLLLNGLLLGVSYGLIFTIGIFLLHSFLREEPRKPDLPQQGSPMKNLIQQLVQSGETSRGVSMLLRGLLRLYIGLDYFREITRPATTLQMYGKLRYTLVAGWLVGLIVGGVAGLMIGVLLAFTYGLNGVFLGLLFGLVIGLIFGLGVTLLAGLFFTFGAFLTRRLRNGLIAGFLFGSLFGLFLGLNFWWVSLFGSDTGNRESQALVDGLSVAIVAILISGLLGSLFIGKSMLIQPADRLTWSWGSLRRKLLAKAHIGSSIGILLSLSLFDGLSFAIRHGFPEMLLRGLVASFVSYLPIGLAYWLLMGIFQSVERETIEDHHRMIPP